MADVNASEFGPGYRYFLVDDGFGKEPFGVAREKEDIPDVDQWTDAGWVEAQWLSEHIANFGSDAGSEEVSGDEAYQWVTSHSQDTDDSADSKESEDRADSEDSQAAQKPGQKPGQSEQPAKPKAQPQKQPAKPTPAVDALRNKVGNQPPSPNKPPNQPPA